MCYPLASLHWLHINYQENCMMLVCARDITSSFNDQAPTGSGYGRLPEGGLVGGAVVLPTMQLP